MKFAHISSILLSSLFLTYGHAIGAETQPETEYPVQPQTQNILIMAAADLELDITMEVIDEDVKSSEEVMHVIEIPLQEMRMEQHQYQKGGDPVRSRMENQTGYAGPDQQQATPGVMDRPDSQPSMQRPDSGGAFSSGMPDSQKDARDSARGSARDVAGDAARDAAADAAKGAARDSAKDAKNDSPLQKGK